MRKINKNREKRWLGWLAVEKQERDSRQFSESKLKGPNIKKLPIK